MTDTPPLFVYATSLLSLLLDLARSMASSCPFLTRLGESPGMFYCNIDYDYGLEAFLTCALGNWA